MSHDTAAFNIKQLDAVNKIWLEWSLGKKSKKVHKTANISDGWKDDIMLYAYVCIRTCLAFIFKYQILIK